MEVDTRLNVFACGGRDFVSVFDPRCGDLILRSSIEQSAVRRRTDKGRERERERERESVCVCVCGVCVCVLRRNWEREGVSRLTFESSIESPDERSGVRSVGFHCNLLSMGGGLGRYTNTEKRPTRLAAAHLVVLLRLAFFDMNGSKFVQCRFAAVCVGVRTLNRPLQTRGT